MCLSPWLISTRPNTNRSMLRSTIRSPRRTKRYGGGPRRPKGPAALPSIVTAAGAAQNPPWSYAVIEKEGSMKLSDIRGNAHYGEGVYAWPAGSGGAGKYIDIEVPPGTGVETLKVGNETWVRMVPPNGNRLPVKIVGSNLSPAQIEWGKKLAKPLSGD